MCVCVVLSLATAMVVDAAFAAYEGKETGESALLRKMFGSFASGDIAVFDRYCCSYMMLALFGRIGVHVCTRLNAKLPDGLDIRRERRALTGEENVRKRSEHPGITSLLAEFPGRFVDV